MEMKNKDLFKTSEEDGRHWRRIPKLSSLVRSPALYRLAFEAKMMLEFVPVASIGIRRFFHRKHPSVEKYVTRGHQIVIDGYPRCANSYSRVRFLLANPNAKPFFGNHIHLPSQILLAVRYGIPTVLLIRDPQSAVLSFTALGMHERGQQDVDNCKRHLAMNLRHYWAFYERVIPVLNSVVVAPFERVVSEFDKVIHDVNDKFGSVFLIPEIDGRSDSEIFESSPEHLSPSEERTQIKNR